jgi:hypothetical protein
MEASFFKRRPPRERMLPTKGRPPGAVGMLGMEGTCV